MMNIAYNPHLHKADVSRSTLFWADCFDVFPFIADKSVDAIIADLPYGTTACKWDSCLPLGKLWIEYERVLKPNGSVILNCSQPFTSVLITSKLEWFKYELIWKKNIPSGFFNAKKQQMKIHENIAVFSKGKQTYNPQMVLRSNDEYKKTLRINDSECFNSDVYGGGRKKLKRKTPEEQRFKYPFTICEYDIDRSYGYDKHPTKKPLMLMEYLVKTYTNENEIVLDNTMGSGTTGLACLKTNRQFIGIEKEKQYYDVAVRRLSEYCG